MANLLNVVPQANSKTVSPSEQTPNKLDSAELKELFQQNLSENLDSKQDLGEVALAAGAVAAPKTTAIDPKTVANTVEQVKAPVTGKEQKTEKSNKGAELAAASGIQVQNQITKAEAAKTEAVKGESAKKEIPVKNTVAPAIPLAAKYMSAVAQMQQPVNAELASAMAGQDLLGLSPDQELDVESIDLKNSDSKTALPKAASSKLSTTDFLNLREISQNQVKPAAKSPLESAPLPAAGIVAMGTKPLVKQKDTEDKDDKKSLDQVMNGLAPAHSAKQTFGKTMDATVTQTQGQKPVLSPESLNQISNQVNILGQARQDGEIKIRLRPDHLGELQMSVRTQGQNVSVQIKAENNEAKKIIEDSLSSLREHLSQQNLSLARIDVVTQPTGASAADQTQMQFDSNQNFNQSSANTDRQQAQDGSQQSRREFYRDEPSQLTRPTSMIRPRAVDSTRLDLIA